MLQRKLAEGGMAEVFLAKQSGLAGFEKPVVVKRILPNLCDDETFVEMFLNEARVAARLSHPSIVQIFDLGKVEDQYYIAMEFIHGEDLRTVAKQAEKGKKRPSYALICRVMADMLGALHYAHTRSGADGKPLGLVHRDISPQNVLVTYEGGVKLVDFGIAKATEASSVQQTQAGLLKGKYAYMSPEQCRGKKLDARSDIFAVGILLWELITWKRLFRRDNDMATLVAVADEAIPHLSQLKPDVPPELDKICARALERDLAIRYPTAQAMQSDLEALIRKYAWEADSIRLQRYMRDLFSDKLKAQDDTVRAAGCGSLEDFLVNVNEGTQMAWMEKPVTAEQTPSAQPMVVMPVGDQSGPVHKVSAPPDASTQQNVVIQPVPRLAVGHISYNTGEHTASTMRHAVGQSVPAGGDRSMQLTPKGTVVVPPANSAKRMVIVVATSIALAAAVLTAVLWPDGTPAAHGDPIAGLSEPTATIRVLVDVLPTEILIDGKAQAKTGKETEVQVSAGQKHEVRVKVGTSEKTIMVEPINAGAAKPVRLRFGG